MKFMWRQVKCLHCFVGNFDSSPILSLVEPRLDLEPRSGLGGSDKIHDDIVTDERAAVPGAMVGRQSRRARHHRNTASAQTFGICRSDKSALPLVQLLEERLLPYAQRSLVLHTT